MENNTRRTPSWIVSLVPIAVLVCLLTLVIKNFGSSALDGGSQVALITASAVAIAIAMMVYKVKWIDIENAMLKNITTIGLSVLILILIGAISGSWMVSGVVPTLIYYGLKVLTPKIFLFATALICGLVSIMIGSSWTTVATIGVALLGIGHAMGYSDPLIAGAIISGAYFGDELSPLSDTTVLASSTAETPLFTHIKYMLYTTIPTMAISLVAFLVLSLTHDSTSAAQVDEICGALKSTFNISPWLLIVPVLTAVLIAKKAPSLITLFLAALMAGVAALIAQPHIISTIGGGDGMHLGFSEGFRGILKMYYGATAIQTGDPSLNDLVATKGMGGMLGTIFLILCATSFGGAMVGSGMIQSLTAAISKVVRRRVSVVASTVFTGVLGNTVMGDQYLSIYTTSSLFKNLYETKGYEGRLLSRSVEDSATVTSVLVPWNTCGMAQSSVLGVATFAYIPYCFYNLLSPLMSIIIAAIGIKIYHKPVNPAAGQATDKVSAGE